MNEVPEKSHGVSQLFCMYIDISYKNFAKAWGLSKKCLSMYLHWFKIQKEGKANTRTIERKRQVNYVIYTHLRDL